MSQRVCVLRQSAFPGDFHVRRNVDALIDAGYEVDVICLREPGEQAHEDYRGGIVYRLPLAHLRGGVARYFFEYGAFFMLALLLLTFKQPFRRYRTVEVYNLPDILVLAAWPARLMGARIVFMMFEVMPEQAAEQLGIDEEHWIIRVLRRLQGVAVRSSSEVIVVSPYDAGLIARHSPRRPPLMMPNVPEDGLFVPRLRAWRPRDNLVLFTHGSLLRRYDIATAIEAMPAILDAVPTARLRIMGAGEARPELEALVARLGLSRQVEFTGLRPHAEVPDAIAAADVCLVPAAVPWLLPNKLFEYAAMAKPVLAGRSPSLEGVFGDAIAYFEPGDPAALARRVLQLHGDPLERERLAEMAHAVYRRHEWRVVKQSYLDLHEHLATRERTWRRRHETV